VVRILSGKKKAAVTRKLKVSKLQKRIDRVISKLADTVTARRVRKNLVKVVKLEKRLIRACKGGARCAIYVANSVKQIRSNSKRALKVALTSCNTESKCVSKVKKTAALVKKRLSGLKISATPKARKGTKHAAKKLLVAIDRSLKKISVSLTSRGVKRNVAKLIKRERKLASYVTRCNTNAKCIALVSTAVAKVNRRSLSVVRRAVKQIRSSCGKSKKCVSKIGKIGTRAIRQLSKVDQSIKTALERLACPLEVSVLRTELEFERLAVVQCQKDQKCRLRHSAVVHKLQANLAGLKGCRNAHKTTEKPFTKVRESVDLDFCNDRIAEWHVDRENLNRQLADRYASAAECKTTACTTSMLVKLRKLHLELNALKRPVCKVTTWADGQKTPAPQTTTAPAAITTTAPEAINSKAPLAK
jgi:hypothetical protein